MSTDLNPVAVWEMSDCMRRLPVRSTVRIAQVEGAAEINSDSRHLKSDSLCGKDTVAYLGLAVERWDNIRRGI